MDEKAGSYLDQLIGLAIHAASFLGTMPGSGALGVFNMNRLISDRFTNKSSL